MRSEEHGDEADLGDLCSEEASGARPARHAGPRRALSWSCGAAPFQCQVEGCGASLEGERKYCLNKRICSEHLNAEHVTRVGFSGLWRFCFQCARLEPVSNFEGTRRTCRERMQRRRLPRRSTSWAADGAPGVAASTPRQRRQLPALARSDSRSSGAATHAAPQHQHHELAQLQRELALQQQIRLLEVELAAVRTSSASSPLSASPAAGAASYSGSASSAGPAPAPLQYGAAGNPGQAWPPGGVLAALPASASAAAAAAAAPMAPQLVPWPRPAVAHAGHLHCVPEDDLLGLLSGIEADIEGGEDPLAVELIQALEAELAGLQECAAAPAVPHAGSVASAGTAFVPAAAPAAVQTSQLAPQQLAACAPGLAPGVPAAAFAAGSLACPAAAMTNPVVVAAAPLPPPQCQMGWASQLAVAPGGMAQPSPAAQAARLAWLEQRNAQLGGVLASVQALFASIHSTTAGFGSAYSMAAM